MTFDACKFTLGQTVYLSVKPDISGMVTGITFSLAGITYFVRWSDFSERTHYAEELTAEKTFTPNTD